MFGPGNQSPINMNQNSPQQYDNWNFSSAYLPPSPSIASSNNQNHILRARDYDRAIRPPFMDPHAGPPQRPAPPLSPAEMGVGLIPPPPRLRRRRIQPRNLNWAMAQALDLGDRGQNTGGSKKRKINKKKRTRRKKDNKRKKTRRR